MCIYLSQCLYYVEGMHVSVTGQCLNERLYANLLDNYTLTACFDGLRVRSTMDNILLNTFQWLKIVLT